MTTRAELGWIQLEASDLRCANEANGMLVWKACRKCHMLLDKMLRFHAQVQATYPQ